MPSRFSALALSLAALLIAGCSALPDTKKIDYKSSTKGSTLEIPPDLTQVTQNDRFMVPEAGGKASTTFSDYAADQKPDAKNSTTRVLPTVDKIRIERSGNQRWLVIDSPPDKLWESVKDFWQELGFVINVERPEAGVMETDWAENRAKIPSDIIRNTLGKILDSLYSSGERDRFRTRFEAGEKPGTTDIFISHRGMVEVYTSTAKDDTRWQPRPADTELEAEMLQRLMVRLGSKEERAEAVTPASTTERVEVRAKLNTANGQASLEVYDRFDRAWRRVGLALDRVGFTVEDRDRAKGLYFVRYVDPDANAGQKQGFFSNLFRSKDDGDSRVQYRIHVQESGEKSVVKVLEDGAKNDPATAKRILNLLLDQLK